MIRSHMLAAVLMVSSLTGASGCNGGHEWPKPPEGSAPDAAIDPLPPPVDAPVLVLGDAGGPHPDGHCNGCRDGVARPGDATTDCRDGAPAGHADAAPPPACMPGGGCKGASTCEHPCGGGGSQHCTCNGAVYFCDLCAQPPDGGAAASDGPKTPACPGNQNVDGQSCTTGGAVCTFTSMSGEHRVCVCGSFGHHHYWFCR